MLTQKMRGAPAAVAARQPARRSCIVGLGSGATARLGAPPSDRARRRGRDLTRGRGGLAASSPPRITTRSKDPRTNLIVGDGRSHLLLTNREYNVIISEPSNPWIAGVAALFTREFFSGARDRLAAAASCASGPTPTTSATRICDRSPRPSVGVSPRHACGSSAETMLLFVGSEAPIDARLAGIERNWRRPGVADDLAKVVGARSVFDPVALHGRTGRARLATRRAPATFY